MNLRRLFLATTLACAAGFAQNARADYPDRPIRFVVPFTSGSSTDLLARAIGNSITQETRQPVVVDNKPGASGFIGAQEVVRAQADGYTIFITTNTTHAANQFLFKKLPYDPVKDFTPLTGIAKGSLVMVVPLADRSATLQDFVATARKKPGALSFASGTSSSRIASELLKSMSGIDVVNVPYKSNPPALQDLIGGQVHMMMADMPTVLPLIKSGKVRPLAVSSKSRSALLPDVPTVDESGVKGYELTYWFAAYAPAGLPPAVQSRITSLISTALRQESLKGILATGGLDAFATTPQELAAFQAAESRKWSAVIKSANIQPE